MLPGFYLDLDRLLMAQFADDESRCDLDFVDRDNGNRPVKTYVVTGKVRVRRIRELLQVVEWGILTGELPPEPEEEVTLPGEGSVRAA